MLHQRSHGTGAYLEVGLGEAAGYLALPQAWGVGVAVVWSAVVSFIAFKLIDLTIGLRVSEEAEREGLDITTHGETAYHH